MARTRAYLIQHLVAHHDKVFVDLDVLGAPDLNQVIWLFAASMNLGFLQGACSL